VKNEELAASVVDEECRDHGGDVGIGGVKSAEADQQVARRRADQERNQRDGVEKHQFVVPFVFTGFEDKQNVEDVRSEVREKEADAFIDPIIPQAERFRNRTDIKLEKAKQLGKRITFGQRWENQPSEKKEDRHIYHGGRAATHSVFDELNERVFLLGQKSTDVFFHKREVCL
jgi:hypothetical protein